ncbi:hypothetical protein BJ878DRAFT_490567 [Calycina marina]|uniref:R3H domain-containing protein n=1 Tax=Calycina marina TaxID=1763456 RepID=A0A9P7Z9P3_9HELO|nr:hypothetical protein BJ878DRAFT_490567 [Calycina marina]
MSTAERPAAAPAGGNRPPRHRRAPRRGGRGGATENIRVEPAAAPSSEASLQLRIAPTNSVPTGKSARPRGGRRGGRGEGFQGNGRRGGAQPMVNGSRVFGGQLTTTPSAPSSVARSVVGSLAPDAPEFVPGRPVAARPRPQQPRARRMSKSQAPDIATRTHEDITNGHYECVICTNEVLPKSKVWSCKTCWSVLHLSCVKRWSKNEVSTHQQRAVENGELPPPRQWRCPGCNLPKEQVPEHYTCWCAKEQDPRPIPGLPHSCGQSCSKSRPGCPHPCTSVCHAGPCPPCAYMGPSLPCFCGKETSSRRCVDTNYDSGWNCGQICGDLLPCGKHTCPKTCHEGLCNSCEVMIESRCCCGRAQQSIPCSEREEELESELEGDAWVGSFDCGNSETRKYDCGEHFYDTTCKPQHSELLHCPDSPDVVNNCPCGKTLLSALLPESRTTCSTPIPHCEEKCQKELACGHSCPQTCHQGECRPCFEKSQVPCRCGRTTHMTMCHQGKIEPPSCMRVCQSNLNCGRHNCGERCCPGEKKASERQASKRKHRALNAPAVEENVEAEHICLRVCGRPLKCGNHACADLCHKGPCRSCLEAIFEDISCACGRTVLQPPQPCGSQPPPCHFHCTRPNTCQHPPIKHQCHPDSVSCPKCSYLVEKPCVCGKRTFKNQPCWFSEVRCGLPCGKKLKCGTHFCQLQCHRPGQCEDATSQCAQSCGRKRQSCEHTCTDKCHAPYPCKETTPCTAKTFITCECQHQKKVVQCLASRSGEGNTKKTLECNDECLKLQRNAKLAAALNIDPTTHLDDHNPYSTETLDLFKASIKFGQTYEREFRVFAADIKEKRLRFKPMQASQRAFIHSLAEDYGLDSESQDPEPHRHVSIFKTPRFVSAPMKTLGQCVKIIKPVPEPTLASMSLVTTAEPYNALLLSNPRFGLTIDELAHSLSPHLSKTKPEISFLPSGDVVVKIAPSSLSWHTPSPLPGLKISIAKKVEDLELASATSLCAVDVSFNVVRREDTSFGGGWSQVAKGGLGGRATLTAAVGKTSSFTVLGKGLAKKEKKEPAEEAVDDWEREVEGWDQ